MGCCHEIHNLLPLQNEGALDALRAPKIGGSARKNGGSTRKYDAFLR